MLTSFELAGYQQVVLPAFEHADVLERGLGRLDPEEVLRFVEPDTAEIVALRPDLTPQVARLFVSRLGDKPLPARLCYRGSVFRRGRARGRRQRQIPQAGVELLGCAVPLGELEVVEVATAAVEAVGLSHFLIDLGHVGVARALLEEASEEHRLGLLEALSLKDSEALGERAHRAGLRGRAHRAVTELPSLHGSGAEIWARAERLLVGTRAEPALVEARALWEAISTREVAPEIVVDLGEPWTFEYYTGTTFQILAEGPGEAIGSGGRYDTLIGCFGDHRPAAGFALDLDNLTWALRRAAVVETDRPRVYVTSAPSTPSLIGALRSSGIVAAAGPAEGGADYARAWGYSHVLSPSGQGAELLDILRGDTVSLGEGTPSDHGVRVAKLLETWLGPARSGNQGDS